MGIPMIGPRFSTRLAIACVVAAAFALSQVAAVAAVGKGWVDDAIRFRSSLGLNDDRQFVQSTFTDEAYSDAAFGVPLSKAEVATIRDRKARTHKATPGHEWANGQPGFAGAWTDQSRDGTIVYQFATNVAAARDKLDQLLPSDVKYEVRRVDRSLEELRQLKGRISGDVEALEKEGTEILSIGLDTSDNTVVVGVAGDASEKRAALKSRYGDFIKVSAEERGQADCNGLLDCLPLKGGIRVIDGPGDGDCTSGYIAKKPNGKFVLVTAGHCIKIGAHGNNWKHKVGGAVLGQSDFNNSVWCCATTGEYGGDVGFFTIEDDDVPSSKTKAIVGHQNSVVKEIRKDLPDWAPEQEQGEVVCRMGWGSINQLDGYDGYSPKKCGPIVATEVEKKSSVPGFTLRWVDALNVWEGDSTGGDSGGIVFTEVSGTGDEIYLLGTHVHSNGDSQGATGNSWYSPVAQGVYVILLKHDLLIDPCTLNDPC